MFNVELGARALELFLSKELEEYKYYTCGMDITYSDSYDTSHNYDVVFHRGDWNELGMRVSNIPRIKFNKDETVDDQLLDSCHIFVDLYSAPPWTKFSTESLMIEDSYQRVCINHRNMRYLWQALLWK